MSQTFANTIDNNPIFAARSTADKDGNQIDTTYATKSEAVPAVTSSDDGKVLKATYSSGQGSYSWETESGGAQVQSDWTESDTTDPSYIQNKPIEYTLAAGSNVTITSDAQNQEITIAASFTQSQADWTESDTTDPSYIQNKPTLATVATSGDYDDLSNTPDLSVYAETSDLATVATTGDYDDLTNKPSIPAAQVNADWNASSGVAEILHKPDLSVYAESANLAAVATSGDYDDLTNKPSIPAAQVNSDWNASSGIAQILNKPTLATVATSGSYNDLSNTPTIPTATSDLTNDSGFITSSDIPAQAQADWNETDTSDPSYIQNKPTIPAAQVNSDWNASSGVAQILNKPTLATVATSGDYDDLINKPTIPTVPVQDVTVDGSSVVSNGTAAITLPTELVPTVTSSDDGKVLKASYSGGTGSYSWETESGGGGAVNDVTVNGTSVVVSGTAAIDLTPYALSSSLATVATSGSYNNLTNKPTITNGSISITSKSSGAISVTGDYGFVSSSADPTSISITNNTGNLTDWTVQWTCASRTTLPTVTLNGSSIHGHVNNPSALVAGKTYQLCVFNNCYIIAVFN